MSTSRFLSQPESYELGALYLLIRSYDESRDVFVLSEYVFEPEHPLVLQTSDSDFVDVDDAEVSGPMLPFLCGEYGEPSELVGRVFKLSGPK